MEPDDPLCSRNARPEKALVGRAQWKINPERVNDFETLALRWKEKRAAPFAMLGRFPPQ